MKASRNLLSCSLVGFSPCIRCCSIKLEVNCTGIPPNNSNSSFLGIIPGSLNEVSKKKMIVKRKRVPENIGIKIRIVPVSVGTIIMKYTRVNANMIPHVTSTYLQSLLRDNIHLPKQQNLFFPGHIS